MVCEPHGEGRCGGKGVGRVGPGACGITGTQPCSGVPLPWNNSLGSLPLVLGVLCLWSWDSGAPPCAPGQRHHPPAGCSLPFCQDRTASPPSLCCSSAVRSGGLSARPSPPFLSQALLLTLGLNQLALLWHPTGWSCIRPRSAPFSLCPPSPLRPPSSLPPAPEVATSLCAPTAAPYPFLED